MDATKWIESKMRSQKFREKLNEKELKATSMLCIPIDEITEVEQLHETVAELHGVVKYFKIGMETFTRFGLDAISAVKVYGADIFLDLKYNDIPNTVKGAAKSATSLNISMFNVHASGGLKMMKAARAGVTEEREGYKAHGLGDIAATNFNPKVLGVTVLTSFDEANYLHTFRPLNPALDDIDFTKYLDMKKTDEQLMAEFNDIVEKKGLKGVIGKQVHHLAELSREAGLDGIVCSSADLYAVRDRMPKDFMYVTPGVVSPEGAGGSDQKRVFTPYNAVKAGSNILVIGRAITKNDKQPDKLLAAYDVLQDMARAL